MRPDVTFPPPGSLTDRGSRANSRPTSKQSNKAQTARRPIGYQRANGGLVPSDAGDMLIRPVRDDLTLIAGNQHDLLLPNSDALIRPHTSQSAGRSTSTGVGSIKSSFAAAARTTSFLERMAAGGSFTSDALGVSMPPPKPPTGPPPLGPPPPRGTRSSLQTESTTDEIKMPDNDACLERRSAAHQLACPELCP